MTTIKATLIDSMGSDLSVVNAARVSFGKQSDWEENPIPPTYVGMTEEELWDTEWREYTLSERDQKLISYLAKHKHLSPFGHAFASFHVKAPIFVARQLVKHKFLRWNEISRRYVDDEPEFYVPDVWRGRSEDKKQGSDGVVDLHPMTFVVDPLDDHEELNEASLGIYNFLLHQGVAPEQARMVLPQSTMTEWYWSGSLDAFAAMCKLRCASDTQYESRVVADQISETMGSLFPVSWEALVTSGTYMKGEE
jgi:thymidylate synthase (FAD)